MAATRPEGSRPWAVRVVVLAVWASALGAWVWHLRATGTTPTDSLQSVVDTLDGAWWAIPAYLAVYALRPLVLFPAILLTAAAGILFGPVVGIGAAVVGSNVSALVAFLIGTTFSPAAVAAAEAGTEGFVNRWSGRLRERSFATVLLLRLALLPFDPVNFAAGFLRISLPAFLAATALGSLPATVSFVLAGASLERLDAGLDGVDARVLIASLALFGISVVVAKIVQRRGARA